MKIETLHKKWNFPSKISSVDLTKSAVSCTFFVQCLLHMPKRPIKENDYTVKKFLCHINVTKETAQLTFTCSKLTKQALEKGVKYVQRYQ